MQSLIDGLTQGGSYWKRERHDSPGHSVLVPHDTPFTVALDGQKSRRIVAGTCRNGWYEIDGGEHSGARFESASAAALTVRRSSTNAFLFVDFRIRGEWINADSYRRVDWSRVDEAEENAIAFVLSRSARLRQIPRPEALLRVAQYIAAHREIVERERELISLSAGLEI